MKHLKTKGKAMTAMRIVVVSVLLATLVMSPLTGPEASASLASVYQIDSGPEDRTFLFRTPGPDYDGRPFLALGPKGTLPMEYRPKLMFDDIDLGPDVEVMRAILTVWAENTVAIECTASCLIVYDDDDPIDPHYLGIPGAWVPLPHWKAGYGYKIDVTQNVQEMIAQGYDPGETSFSIEFSLYNPFEDQLRVVAYEGSPSRAASLAIQLP